MRFVFIEKRKSKRGSTCQAPTEETSLGSPLVRGPLFLWENAMAKNPYGVILVAERPFRRNKGRMGKVVKSMEDGVLSRRKETNDRRE